MKRRRYFKITEINLMKKLASENQSQMYVANLLGRDPGVIAQAAIRYEIKFQAKPGPKTILTDEERMKKRAEASRLYRERRGAKRRLFRVKRFDDPRVMKG